MNRATDMCLCFSYVSREHKAIDQVHIGVLLQFLQHRDSYLIVDASITLIISTMRLPIKDYILLA